MIKVKIQVLNCSGHLEVNVSERILNRIKNIFGTGVATRVETGIVQLKLATGILNDRIARVHNYGFMSRPLPGAKGFTLFVAGDTSRGIAVCMEDKRHQMELKPGEVAMLDDKGNLIHFHSGGIDMITKQTLTVKAENEVNITCKTSTVTADENTINGDTIINGKLAVSGAVTMAAPLTVPAATIGDIPFGTHKHKENDSITGGPQ